MSQHLIIDPVEYIWQKINDFIANRRELILV